MLKLSNIQKEYLFELNNLSIRIESISMFGFIVQS